MTTNIVANQRVRELSDVGHECVIKTKHIVSERPVSIGNAGVEEEKERFDVGSQAESQVDVTRLYLSEIGRSKLLTAE